MPKTHPKKHEKSESMKQKIKEYGVKKATAKVKTTAKPKTKMEKIMHEFKIGELNIGKSKKMVKSRKQAIAIGLSEMGMTKKK